MKGWCIHLYDVFAHADSRLGEYGEEHRDATVAGSAEQLLQRQSHHIRHLLNQSLTQAKRGAVSYEGCSTLSGSERGAVSGGGARWSSADVRLRI